ncbi:MAG: hypothetical protein ACRD9Q_09850, partial [Nitrososphaeraceae archaeon]
MTAETIIKSDKIESVFLKSKICLTCLIKISGNDEMELTKHANHNLVEDNMTADNEREFLKLQEENKKTGSVFAYNPHILDEIQQDLSQTHVGDNKNKVLVVTLLASSMRRGHEQALIIQKQSSAGGSDLQNACLAYFDNKITLTRMTGAYLDRSKMDYNGKILALGEMSGFDSTSSSLRQKLSEGKTELATTDKDEKGRIITDILKTEGRPSFITTTTSEEIHQEFENRCWILSIDESSNQTKAVNRRQFSKDTFEYKEWSPRNEIKALFNSGTLKGIKVVNPFATLLGENFPCDNITARRDSRRFAELVTTITWIYQYQRIKIKRGGHTFVLVAYEDLRNAIYFGQDALKSTLNKLNEKTESVIGYMKACQQKEFFTRNEIGGALNIPYATMKRILTKLVDRSFIEVNEENRIWKYKLSNKSMIEGIALGSEKAFEESALEYLARNVPNFEEIIIPTNYESMKGVDASIVESLLSFTEMVTTESDNISGIISMP